MGQRRDRDAGRPVRDVLAAAAAHSAVQVVLDPLRARLGISSCWQDLATPASRASARSAPHSHVPDGYQSRVPSGSAQVIAAPGAPGCLPRFLFFSAGTVTLIAMSGIGTPVAYRC